MQGDGIRAQGVEDGADVSGVGGTDVSALGVTDREVRWMMLAQVCEEHGHLRPASGSVRLKDSSVGLESTAELGRLVDDVPAEAEQGIGVVLEAIRQS